MLAEDIAQRFTQTLDGWSDDGLDLCRAGRDASAAFVRPTLEALNGTASQLLEECFGPVTVVASYQSLESLIAFLDAGDGTLSSPRSHPPPEFAGSHWSFAPARTVFYQRVVTGNCVNAASAVTKASDSISAWAASILSKGSLTGVG